MNLRKLNIFYQTATCLNMSKVAKDMYISQPSISQSITELETELEVKLFDRIGKKLYLTYEGEVFLNYTRRILNLYEEGVSVIKEGSKENKGKITIGASTTIGIYILPHIIKEFSKKYPNIEISIIIENTAHIETLLLENKIDFAYVEGNLHSEELNSQKIWDDELVFICGEEHRWKGKEIITSDDLSSEKLVMREKGSGTREILESYLVSENIPYDIYLELGNTEAIKNIVEANLGIGCTSFMTVKEKSERGEIEILRIEDNRLFRDLLLITHRDKYISSSMKQFIEFSKSFDIYK